MSWKKIIGWVLAALVVIGVVGTNMYQRQHTGSKPKVYAILPLSGSVADFGQKIKSYITIYMNNTHDVPFEVVYLDDESKPDRAVSVFQQTALTEDKPIVISAFSFISRILIPMVEKEGGFTFALTTIEKEKLGIDSSNYQRMAGGIYDETTKLLNYAKKFNTISIINMEDDLGIAEKDLFIQEYPKDGRKILTTIGLPLRTFDVRNEVQKIIANPPEAVFLSGTVTLAYINAIRILKENGYSGEIIANLAFSNPYTYKDLGKISEGIVALTVPSDIIGGQIKDSKLIDQLKKEGIPAFFLPIQVFDTMDLIKYTFDNNLPFIQETYTKMGKWDGVSGTVKLNNGDSFYSYIVAKIKDGKFTPVEE